MPVVDLGQRPPAGPAASPWATLPRRVGLTRRELEHVADLVGGAPLPFETISERAADPGVPGPASPDPGSPDPGSPDPGSPDPGSPGSPDGRLGTGPAGAIATRLQLALSHPADPAATLARRGLVVDGRLDDGLRGAVGLLATPTLALDVDVSVEDLHVRAWHRQAGDAVATLATCDGVVFELGWFDVAAWPTEIGRAARLPQDLELRRSTLPALVDLPFELLDAATEAARAHRPDLLPVLAERYAGSVVTDDGSPLDVALTRALLAAIGTESRGRLRVLGADVGEDPRSVGVVSWLLLADGWHALRPHGPGEALRVELRLVTHEDLPSTLAPVLAEAVR